MPGFEELLKSATAHYHSLGVKALVSKLHDLVTHPPFDLSDLPAIVDAIKHQGNIGIDDRLLLLEKLLHAMATLDKYDSTRALSQDLQHFLVGILYKDLPNPPSGFLSPVQNLSTVQAIPSDRKYPYRPADGSNYNPLAPTLGKAGHPYARSATSAHCTSQWALPDAGLVFDTLLKRDEFVPHPSGISSLFFAFADLVVHDLFYTSHQDSSINNTSSYLDLSILYGTSEAQVDSVRRKDGTGRLWDDVFADGRLLHMPPAACALVVLLSRNHNYIAQRILEINEWNRFTQPPPTDQAKRIAQDDEIFERARLVNCGYFMQIIVRDYVGVILGLVQDGSSWRIDPLTFVRDHRHEVLPRGEGNVVSVEFNLIYTWHSSLSLQDTEWTTNQFKTLFPGADPRALRVDDFGRALPALMPGRDPRKWIFGGLRRTPSGSFGDADIAQLLYNAIEWRAAAFKARGIPETLRVIELMNIERARKWGACTLNEFRKFLGLKQYESFQEWNKKPEIVTAAESLYHHIDNLELYVGLQAEEAKKPGAGAGLCPGYTISRAILSDAVRLTRGDRFLTVDFTPSNLTLWGYQYCQYDAKDGSYGFISKLLCRTLPDYFPANSAYTHFPFLNPTWLEDQMIQDGRDADASQYIWTRRSRLVPPPVAVTDREEVERVLTDPAFTSDFEDRFYKVFGISPTTEGIKTAGQRAFRGEVSEYFAAKTRELINERSFGSVGGSRKQIDIIRDVINWIPTLWLSHTSGVKLSMSVGFADVGRYIYLNDDPASDWHLCLSARKFVDHVTVENPSAMHFVAAAIPTAPYFSKALAHIVDYYLSDDKLKERNEITKLATESESVITYIKTALRHYPVVSGLYKTAVEDKLIGIRVLSAQRVYANITEANTDTNILSDGADVSAESPVIIGIENTGFFTSPFFEEAVSAVLGVIFELGKVRRATGDRGSLHRHTEYVMGTPTMQYIDRHGQVTPWPQSMIIEYQ